MTCQLQTLLHALQEDLGPLEAPSKQKCHKVDFSKQVTWLQSRSLSGRHVSTGFLDPVLGALMKQVCWHSRRSKAYRGLPEARMAGATVEETAFEDVNMWQAPVSQKPPLMGT